ncbi:MAG: hypothetical protein GY938_04100, partial [Ketobacter sp.]|nr:hypothetical protein [Ketobacter sp.]
KKLKQLKKKCKSASRKLQRTKRKAKNNNNNINNNVKYQAQKRYLKKLYNKKTNEIIKAKKQWKIKTNNFIQKSRTYGRKFWKTINGNDKIAVNDIPPLKDENNEQIIEPKQQTRLLHSAMTHPPNTYSNKWNTFHEAIKINVRERQNKLRQNIYTKNNNEIIHPLNDEYKCEPDNPCKINSNIPIPNNEHKI